MSNIKKGFEVIYNLSLDKKNKRVEAKGMKEGKFTEETYYLNTEEFSQILFDELSKNLGLERETREFNEISPDTTLVWDIFRGDEVVYFENNHSGDIEEILSHGFSFKDTQKYYEDTLKYYKD